MPYRRAKQPGPLLRRRSVGTARSIRLSALTLLLALSVAPRVAHAQSVDQVVAQAKQGYVTDLAGVLSQSGKNQLTALCAEVQQKTQAQIAVVTIKSLGDQPIEDYSIDLATKLGVGPKSDEGVLVLFAVDDHRYRIEVGYGLEDILPDGKVGTFGREIVPYLRRGNYDAGILLLTRRIADTIATDHHVALSGSAPPPMQLPRPPGQNAPVGGFVLIFLFFFLLLFFTAIMRAAKKGALTGGRGYRGGGGNWWIGPMIGGMGGGFGGGGGGFGGGGGGFGGFGGGSFGGGGASGSW
jgi:uncharacterized protein